MIIAPGSVAGALVTGIILSLALGLSIGPLAQLFNSAATQLGTSQ